MNQFASRKIMLINYVMILEVILFHTNLRYDYPIIEDMCYVALDFFFIISGYMCFKENDFDFKRLVKKRSSSLLIPYFIWNVIAIFVCSIMNADSYVIVNAIKNDPLISPVNYPT